MGKAKAGGRRKKVQTYVAPVALDENGQPIDPRANDPVTLAKAYSDYNIFERTYDYASRVSMVSRSSLKEQHSTRRKTKKMAPLPAVHTLIPASMVAWSSSTGLPIPKVTVPPLPTFCHPLTEKNKPCTFCDK